MENTEYLNGAPENSMKYSERRLKDYRKKSHVKRGRIDIPFLILTIMMLSIGVIMVLSASSARAYYESGDPTEYFVRQLIFAVSGVGIMLVMSRMKVSFLRRVSMPLLGLSVFLLLLVPLIGVEDDYGTKRWLSLGITTFQPSELAKLAVIMSFAAMICNYKGKMKTFKYGVLPFGIVLAVVVGLLVIEPHLSASIIIIAIGGIMMFAGGTKLRWFGLVIGVVVVCGFIASKSVSYVQERINSWQHPFDYIESDGYQVVQSLYAIGSGGFLGLGLGQGRQKLLYLPEEHNDFIFSVVCEELGFVGAILILCLFALLIIRGFWLAMHAKTRYGALVTVGISSLLAIQVFLNVAVVTNLIPCTGISLPFFSYGGTALWIQLAEMGIVLAISRDIPLSGEEDDEDQNDTPEIKEG